MPILDAYILEGALSAGAERELLAKITGMLLEKEGVGPKKEKAEWLGARKALLMRNRRLAPGRAAAIAKGC